MKKNNWKINASIVCHENGRPTLYLGIDAFDMQELVLEAGKQPGDLFIIVVRRRGGT